MRKSKKKNDDTLLWIVGGSILAFGAYEVFIKPKAVTSVVPVSNSSGTAATVTQAKLPAPVSPLNQITALAQSVASIIKPPATSTQAPPMTYNPGPTNSLPASNFYVDSPVFTPPDNAGVDNMTPILTPVSVDQSAKQAYDSAMYAQYESSLGGLYSKFEV